MENTTKSTCPVCRPACPDALGFPSSCEIEQMFSGKATGGHHFTPEEHDKNMALLHLWDKAGQLE